MGNMTTPSPDPLALQATLVDFALAELVRQHRESFEPLWSQESWAKLLIWLALNCGCSGDEAGLKTFAEAIGTMQMGRLRRVFFERELGDLELQLMADPAEQQVLVLPQGPAEEVLQNGRLAQAFERVGLTALLPADQARWQQLDAVVVVPWLESR
jgi:hypothetical protein